MNAAQFAQVGDCKNSQIIIEHQDSPIDYIYCKTDIWSFGYLYLLKKKSFVHQFYFK